jgi:hypothetical protein
MTPTEHNLKIDPLFHSKIADASSETMSLAYCATQLQNAVTCVQADPSTCGECFDVGEKFDESLASTLDVEFRQTLAIMPATQRGFCAESNARMCNYHRDRMVSPPQLEHARANAICCISSQL